MGKIFGLSDLPVSTIESAFRPVRIPAPMETVIKTSPHPAARDTFEPVERTFHKSNSFIKMRNGIGRLMKHFSKRRNSK